MWATQCQQIKAVKFNVCRTFAAGKCFGALAFPLDEFMSMFSIYL